MWSKQHWLLNSDRLTLFDKNDWSVKGLFTFTCNTCWIIYIQLYIFEGRLSKGNNEVITSWLLSRNCCNTIKVRQYKYSSKLSRAIILANKTFQHHNIMLLSSNTNNLYVHLCLFRETFKTKEKEMEIKQVILKLTATF